MASTGERAQTAAASSRFRSDNLSCRRSFEAKAGFGSGQSLNLYLSALLTSFPVFHVPAAGAGSPVLRRGEGGANVWDDGVAAGLSQTGSLFFAGRDITSSFLVSRADFFAVTFVL